MAWFSVTLGVLLIVSVGMQSVGGIGANWGTQASHPLPPDTVVTLLRDNRFQKVKLFDADYDALRALGKSGIEVMVGTQMICCNFCWKLEAAENGFPKISLLISPPTMSTSGKPFGFPNCCYLKISFVYWVLVCNLTSYYF